jgi:signal transduction histidine kinase
MTEAGPDMFVATEQARVLVADDDPILREFASVHLATPAVEVETAEDGVAALDRLLHGDIDIALIDLDMPRMDGFELIGHIRATPALQHLPIVVVTGREDMEAIDKAYGCGANAFVVKPLNWRLLSHQLAYVLRNSRSEAEVREAHEKAARADALKTNLLRLMRHEFNTPMSVIMGFGQLIEAHSGEPAVQSHARHIVAAARNFKALHDGLMDSARVLSGDVQPAPQAFKAGDLLKAAAREALKSGGRSADLRLIDRTGGAESVADWQLTTLALSNLIGNALAHGAAPVLVSAALDASGTLQLTVEDSGGGIAPERVAEVMEPFAQSDGALSRKSKGLGIGLATVEGCMRAQGGSLSLENRHGGGLVAQMELPRAA